MNCKLCLDENVPGRRRHARRARRGDAAISPLLGFGKRLIPTALALDMRASAFSLEPRLALADVASVGRINHHLEAQHGVLAGVADLDLAFGGQRRTTAAFTPEAWRGVLQQPQSVAKLVELRLALLVGKQAVFDNGNQVRVVRQHHARNGKVFSSCSTVPFLTTPYPYRISE